MLQGRLVNSLSGDPIAGATVVLDEAAARDGFRTRRHVSLRQPRARHLSRVRPHDGIFVAPYRGDGVRRPRRILSTCSVDPDLHFQEVASVSAEARSQFDVYQPTSVLAGQDLSKQLEMSIGATLENQPGVASRTFGPATARPVIRGLDGDRVLILQDGQRMGDLSTQSADHAVTVNPAAAQRIEVVRGPATLLYGSNAIGGLVNVLTDQILTTPLQGTTGNVIFDVGSAAEETGAAGDVRVGNGKFALVAGGGGRRSGDVQTPEGEVVNSQSRSGFGNIGLSWTGSKGYLGGSYGYDDTKLGIPVVEEGILQSTPRKHSFSLRGGARDLTGAFDSFRATATIRRYKHEELEGEEVGTAFKNDTTELELIGNHRALGRLKGSVGAWVLDRAFDAVGAEALSPAVDQNGFAGFLFEEVTWPHVTLQFGGRVDHSQYTPAGETERTFTTGSGSGGILFRPAAANDAVTIAVSAGPLGALPGDRRALLLRAASGQLRLRNWES